MKWFKLDSDFIDSQKVEQCLDELGHKGFTVWIFLMGFLSEQYKGDSSQSFKVYTRRFHKRCKISSQNLHKTITKLSEIFHFSFTKDSDFYNFSYPKFLEKQQKFSVSLGDKGFHRSTHIDKEEDIEEEKKENIKRKKVPKPKLTDEEWLAEIKQAKCYSHIDFDTELERMDIWLMNKPGRKKTRRFIINWLNKKEKPIEVKNSDPFAEDREIFRNGKA